MEAANLGGREADVAPAADPTGGRLAGWTPADPGPLGLAAFAGTTFRTSSLINSGLVGTDLLPGGGLLPMVAALALAYGGIAQFTAGLWEFRTGNTFGAVGFCSYGAFWISFFFIVQSVGKNAPTEVFSGLLGSYLWMWGIFTTYMFIASLEDDGGRRACVPAPGDHVLHPRDRERVAGRRSRRDQRHDQARRLVRHRDRDLRVVRIVRRGDQLDLRSGRRASCPAQTLTTQRNEHREAALE